MGAECVPHLKPRSVDFTLHKALVQDKERERERSCNKVRMKKPEVAVHLESSDCQNYSLCSRKELFPAPVCIHKMSGEGIVKYANCGYLCG